MIKHTYRYHQLLIRFSFVENRFEAEKNIPKNESSQQKKIRSHHITATANSQLTV